MAKTDKLEFTNALRISVKRKRGKKYHNCIWLPRVKQTALGERHKKGQQQVMILRPQGTHNRGLFDREAVISKGKPNVTQSLWSSTSSSPPCKSHWKQVQEVCLHRWLKNTSPAQASLVTVVGSLGFALCARTKEVFCFFFKFNFAKLRLEIQGQWNGSHLFPSFMQNLHLFCFAHSSTPVW